MRDANAGRSGNKGGAESEVDSPHEEKNIREGQGKNDGSGKRLAYSIVEGAKHSWES